MGWRKFVTVGTIFFLFLSGTSFFVDESRSAERNRRAKVTIHVARNHKNASNNNPGTKAKPFATIRRGAARAANASANGKRVVVIIHRGTYREGITFHAEAPKRKLGPVAFRGARGKRVTISGSQVWDGWNQLADGVYVRTWPYRWGHTPLPSGWQHLSQDEMPLVIRRREMIFVNGRRLTQVMSRDELNSRRNSFFVSESDGAVYVRLRKGLDLRKRKVEVAVRPLLFGSNGYRGLTLRNLTFQHANTPLDRAAVFFSKASGLTVKNSNFLQNNWRGLGLYRSKNVVIKNTRANRNGVGGVSANRTTGTRFVDTETSYNNWRGSRGWNKKDHSIAIRDHFIDFATGQKFFHVRDAFFLRHKAARNLTGGIWFDYDNEDVVMKSPVLKNNLTHGAFIEASQGPFRINRGRICNNETGILLQKSTKGKITRTAFAKNILGQILVSGGGDARQVTDRDNGKVRLLEARHWKLRGNRYFSSRGQFHLRTYLPNENWNKFVKTLRAGENRYHFRGHERKFRIAGGNELSLRRWKRYSGQDAGSSASKKSVGCSLQG